MKPHIDPRIDCVFKALLGADENRALLIHFLNAVLVGELSAPITRVEILNPYNEREFLDDKLSIVDVKARDGADLVYQIEIQLLSNPHLPARIMYGWADIYSEQLKSGADYSKLRPVYAIWLLAENLLEGKDYARDFQMRDIKGRRLVEHGGIWVLELAKFDLQQIDAERERWLRFFVDGENLDDEKLPSWMDTREMRQAMGTLRKFSEKERDYHVYQARQNYLREQRAIQADRDAIEEAHRVALVALQQEREEKEAALQREEAAVKQKEAAVKQKEAAVQREEAALEEIERLKALLRGKT